MIRRSPIASIISDPRLPDNPIVAVNNSFLQLTGYSAQEVLGRNCRLLSRNKSDALLGSIIGAGVCRHQPAAMEVLNYTKAGRPFRNAVMIAPLYDEEGLLRYFLGSQVEITGLSETYTMSVPDKRLEILSPRQRQVTSLVVAGLRNKQIAGALGLSEKTVKMHRGLAMSKLQASSAADFVRIALESGLGSQTTD